MTRTVRASSPSHLRAVREFTNRIITSVEPISITLNSSHSESSHQKKRQGSSSGEGLVKSKWADPKTASGRPDTSSKDPVSAATTMGVMQAGGPDTTSDTKASETEMAPETKVATASAAVEEEDREHLTVFRSWGTPAPRDKPGTVQTPKLYSASDANVVNCLQLLRLGVLSSAIFRLPGRLLARFCR